MRFSFFLVCFCLPCCFAQTNPMEYFYKGRHGEAIPDFAALAVLERQNCPLDIRNEEQICMSRYRIIRILDAKLEAIKKEYIEAREKPVFPYFRHRPVLIFGKHKDGHLQIEGYEDIREYPDYNQVLPFSPFVGLLGNIYAFHSIGTPYYDIKNLDSIDILFYNEYLMSEVKYKVEVAGKNFGKLLLRLTQNRTTIKAAKIKNNFVALGAIKNLCLFNDSKRTNLYELGVEIETVIKNDAKIDPNTAILIDRDRLPLGWGCQPLDYYLETREPFYFFGDLRNGSLVIDSLISPQDAFVFADTIYDISMGLPFEELISYFLPSNVSIEEARFGNFWDYSRNLNFTDIRGGRISEKMTDMPECLRNNIIEIAIKSEDYLDKLRLRKEKSNWPIYYELSMLSYNQKFRCSRYSTFQRGMCRIYDLKDREVWGCKYSESESDSNKAQ